MSIRPNSEFRIVAALAAEDLAFEAREIGDGRVALFELLQDFQGVSGVIVLG